MKKTIFLAGGCFWGTQKYMDQIKGVCETEVGFANGNTVNPSYEEVCHNNTGHAETVRVIYDDAVLSLPQLLRFYFRSINPTSLNRQGEDQGQPVPHWYLLYRSAGGSGYSRRADRACKEL